MGEISCILLDALYFDQLEVGREWVSDPRLVRPDDVQQFADLTGDHSPVHVNPAFAATTPFRQCTAHGLLVMSLGGGLTLNARRPVRTLASFAGIREWRFVGPVFFGDEIRVRNRVEAVNAARRGSGRAEGGLPKVQGHQPKQRDCSGGCDRHLGRRDGALPRRTQRADGEMASA